MKGEKSLDKYISRPEWKSHPGVEVVVLTPREMERHANVGISGKVGGSYGPISIGGMDIEQRFIFLSSEASPMTLGHEIGHAALRHEKEGLTDAGVYVRHELEAWKWSLGKKGRKLLTSILDRIGISTMRMYGTRPEEVARLIADELGRLGYKVDPGGRAYLRLSLKSYHKQLKSRGEI